MSVSLKFLTATLLAAALLLGGCVSSKSAKVYSRDQVQHAQRVELGKVVSVEEVLIEGTKSQIGTAAGGAIGGIAGRSSSRGTTGEILSVVGAVVGGIAGAAAEEAYTRRKGLEITVRLDSGETLSIVQEADEPIAPGDRVRILTGADGVKRVARY